MLWAISPFAIIGFLLSWQNNLEGVLVVVSPHPLYLIILTCFMLFFFLFWLFSTDEQCAAEFKRRQQLRNIPNHRLFRSLLHMAGLNIAFIGAVSLVFLVTFGLCGHLVKIAFSTLGNVLLRR